MGIKSIVVLALIRGTMTACDKSRVYNEAPTDQAEAQSRVIVAINDSESIKNQLLASTQSYRVLNAQHGLYEVKGLTATEVLEIAPQAQVMQNKYFESIIKTNNPHSTKASIYKKLSDNTKLSTPPTNSELPPALVGCNLSSMEKPLVDVSLLSNVLSQSPTMDLNEVALLKGVLHLTSPSNEPSEYRWELMPPASSNLKLGLQIGETIDLKPDTVGLYQLALVVKTKNNSCGIKMIQFLVTYNPEVEMAVENEKQPTVDLHHFKHLKKINLEKAWSLSTGKGIKIAVLDTGLNYNHPGIKFNLAFNEKELNGSALSDDDGNELQDDILGWDFVNGDNKPFDDEGHGTHVSGLSSSHIHGAAKDSKVLPVKVLNAAGGGDLATLIAGIYYAVDSDVQVINTSLGFLKTDVAMLREAILYAQSKNIVFVTAAGNDNLDLSLPENSVYPAEIDSPNLISVGATGIDNELTSYSNFGLEEVDVAAPGGDQFEPIFSLTTFNPKNMPFIGQGGTSMASPIVAGVVALLLEVNPSLKPEDVKSLLMESGTSIEKLKNKIVSGQIINAEAAVIRAQKMQNQFSSL